MSDTSNEWPRPSEIAVLRHAARVCCVGGEQAIRVVVPNTANMLIVGICLTARFACRFADTIIAVLGQ
jgi:hypothetical protein